MTSLLKMKLRELPLRNEKDKGMSQTKQQTLLLVLKEILVKKTLQKICLRLRRRRSQRQTQFRWKIHQEAQVGPTCHPWSRKLEMWEQMGVACKSINHVLHI